jgi:hypothetical protein
MKITSFLQACKALNYNPKTILPNVSKMPRRLQAHHIARAKLEVIAEASRGGVELDYDNSEQRKWYGWFWLNKPGFRFDVSDYDITTSGSCGGPRLCYLTEEDSDYHCKKHIALYKAAMVMPKKKTRATKK